MANRTRFSDDGYPHLDWAVETKGDEVTFHANVDHYNCDPGEVSGEFTLTLTRERLQRLLDDMPPPVITVPRAEYHCNTCKGPCRS